MFGQFTDDAVMNVSSLDRQLDDWEDLVVTTLPLVHHVVSDVAGRLPQFIDRDDLIAAGMLGLTQAARTYDASRGVTFQTFARVRIRGAVLDELRRRDPLSRGARRHATQVTITTSHLESELGRRPSDAEVACHLRIDDTQVRRARDDLSRAASMERPVSLVEPGDLGASAPLSEASPLAQILDTELRGYLIDAVAGLPERLRSLVIAHFFDGREMRDIALDLGITASRVSQLCAEAIALLRDGLNAQLDPEKVVALGATTGRVARRKNSYYQHVAAASTLSQRLDRRRSVQDAVTAAAA